MNMPSGSQPKPGPFARAVSDQVRHALTDHRVSAAQVAAKTGRSQSYMSKRLRNEAAFTANDIEAICEVLGVDLLALLRAAVLKSRERHGGSKDS